MRINLGKNGHDESPGKVAVTQLSPECSLFYASTEAPPPEKEMPLSITNVLIRWMEQTKANVRHSVPIVKDGQTIVLFVWHDPL